MSNERFTCFPAGIPTRNGERVWMLHDNETNCCYEVHEIDKPIPLFVEELNRLYYQNNELKEYWLLNH